MSSGKLFQSILSVITKNKQFFLFSFSFLMIFSIIDHGKVVMFKRNIKENKYKTSKFFKFL